jgi:hypothetical protein
MEHRDPREATLQREEIDIARRARTEKGQKRALKRGLLGPRWFRKTVASALERMAGTTRLELATSAVTEWKQQVLTGLLGKRRVETVWTKWE